MIDKIGVFEIIEDLGSEKNSNGRSAIYLKALCPECSNTFKLRKSDARRNQSCGCARYKHTPHNKTHGDSRTKIHYMWMNMIARVDKSEHYKDISLCDEWRNDYLAFKEFALNNGYEEGLSIDRIDGNGNYEPSNIRFVTRAVQSANRNGDKSRKYNLPKGVYFDKRRTTYFSSITVGGTAHTLGAFKTIDGAMNRYNEFIKLNNLEETYPLSVI